MAHNEHGTKATAMRKHNRRESLKHHAGSLLLMIKICISSIDRGSKAITSIKREKEIKFYKVSTTTTCSIL